MLPHRHFVSGRWPLSYDDSKTCGGRCFFWSCGLSSYRLINHPEPSCTNRATLASPERLNKALKITCKKWSSLLVATAFQRQLFLHVRYNTSELPACQHFNWAYLLAAQPRVHHWASRRKNQYSRSGMEPNLEPRSTSYWPSALRRNPGIAYTS